MGVPTLFVFAAFVVLARGQSQTYEGLGYKRAPDFDCKGLSMAVYHPDPNSCSRYHVCDSLGDAYVNDCGEGGAFDAATLSCKLQEELACKSDDVGEQPSDVGVASDDQGAAPSDAAKLEADGDVERNSNSEKSEKPVSDQEGEAVDVELAEQLTVNPDPVSDQKGETIDDELAEQLTVKPDPVSDQKGEAIEDELAEQLTVKPDEPGSDQKGEAIDDGLAEQITVKPDPVSDQKGEGIDDELAEQLTVKPDEPVSDQKGEAMDDELAEQETLDEPTKTRGPYVGDCTGKPDGRYAIHGCKSYYQCQDGATVFSSVCPSATSFDEGQQRCVVEGSVTCATEVEDNSDDLGKEFEVLVEALEDLEDAEEEDEEFCAGKEALQRYLTADADCAKFRICQQGRSRVLDCPPFTTFEAPDPEGPGRCVHFERAVRRPDCAEKDLKVLRVKEGFRCPEDPSSSDLKVARFHDHFRVAHPHDCSRFFVCSHQGRGQRPQSCEEPEVYDVDSGNCVHESEAAPGCKDFWSRKRD